MLIWTESYEAVKSGAALATKYNAVGSNNAATTLTASGAQKRTGIQGGDTVGTHIVDLVGTDQDDLIIVGFARFFNNTTSCDLLRLYGGGGLTQHFTLHLDAGGTLKVYRGSSGGGTLLATATAAVPVTSTQLWYHFDVKVRLSDTVGSVEVRLDGMTVAALTLSGVDTYDGGTNTVFDRIILDGSGSVPQDDMYVCNEQGSTNTDFLGPVHVAYSGPKGNGSSSMGVGSDGNSTDNYLLVDEVLSVVQGSWGGDYVDLAATGDKDTYSYFDLSPPDTSPGFPVGNAVKGVMVWTHAEKTDAGVRSVQAIARLTGTEVNSALLPLLNGAFRTLGAVFETKPGGGAWTVNDVNAAEFGMTAST